RGIDGAVAAATKGHDAVLSPAPTLYFDNRQSAADTEPGRGAIVTIEDVYKFNPMPSALPPDQRHHILGIQANIWTEHIRTEQRVDYMAFPRAAAVAEVGWSPAEGLDWSRFRERLFDQMGRYDMLGVDAFNAALQRSSYQLRSCTRKVL